MGNSLEVFRLKKMEQENVSELRVGVHLYTIEQMFTLSRPIYVVDPGKLGPCIGPNPCLKLKLINFQ